MWVVENINGDGSPVKKKFNGGRTMNVPEKCVYCVHHKVSSAGLDYCDYIEHLNGCAGTPVPYPHFYKQEYPCKGHEVNKMRI